MGRRLKLVAGAWAAGFFACSSTAQQAAPASHPSAEHRAPDAPLSSDPCGSARWFEKAERLSPEVAIGFLRQCLPRRPAPASAWRLLASLEADAGLTDRARSTLLRAVAIHPSDAFSWAALARIEALKGRGRFALGAYERAHRLQPDDEGLRSEWEQARFSFGSLEDQRRVRIVPILSEADGRLELGDLEGALSTLRVAEVLAEDSPLLQAEILLRRSLIDLALGRVEAAAEAARLGLTRVSDTASDLSLRAELYIALAEAELSGGQPGRAVASAREAERAAPHHPLALTNLGVALLRVGQSEEAANTLLRALDSGLGRRIDRSAFLSIEGVRGLVDADPRLGRRVEEIWPTNPGATTEAGAATPSAP